MKPGALWFMYRNRVRAQLGEELLALFGIAVGVANRHERAASRGFRRVAEP